jgi:hypothetical protein
MLSTFQKEYREKIIKGSNFKMFLQDGTRKVSASGKRYKVGSVKFIWIANSEFKKYRILTLSKTKIIGFYTKRFYRSIS